MNQHGDSIPDLSSGEQAEQTSVIGTLERGLCILDAVADQQGITVEQLSRTVSVPTSTLYRYVRYLREAGFLSVVDGMYTLGPRRQKLQPPAEPTHLVQIAQPVLRLLLDRVGEAAILTVRVQLAAMTLDRLLPRAHSTLSFQRGRVKPLYAGASATALLAWAPRHTIATVINGRIRRITAATRSPQSLTNELREIRTRGYAVSHGEVDPLMSAIAAPVFRNGACLCAVSAAGVTTRIAGDRLPDTIDAVLQAASDLQTILASRSAKQAWQNEPLATALSESEVPCGSGPAALSSSA